MKRTSLVSSVIWGALLFTGCSRQTPSAADQPPAAVAPATSVAEGTHTGDRPAAKSLTRRSALRDSGRDETAVVDRPVQAAAPETTVKNRSKLHSAEIIAGTAGAGAAIGALAGGGKGAAIGALAGGGAGLVYDRTTAHKKVPVEQ